MRKKKLLKNTISSLIFQITTIVCSLILPRFFLEHYGSEVNGLISSITQFLAVISFLELGVGVVVQSALYEPLATGNNIEISKIVVSASKFFKKIAIILVVYMIFLILLYPRIVAETFDFIYTAVLICAIGISHFAQYYFGVVDRLLLLADQRGYVQYTIRTITLIFNTCMCVILIEFGASIQLVKLTTSFIYLLRPFILRIYVKRHYEIDRKIKYSEEPIKQKWSGFAQHISAVIVDNTDMIVLTFLSTLENVSIYYVYHMVVNAIKQIILALSAGVQSLFGNMLAKKEIDKLKNTFSIFEIFFGFVITYLYSCVLCLIVPFVKVYTNGVHDTNYDQPFFAVILTLAYAMFCYRIMYYTLIKAAGHFKETQMGAIIEAVLNVVISVIAVFNWGLIGVAVGTLISVTYRTLYCVWYLSKKILKRPLRHFITNFLLNSLCCIGSYWSTSTFVMEEITYWGWIELAIKTALINLLVCLIAYIVIYREVLCEMKCIIVSRKIYGKDKMR